MYVGCHSHLQTRVSINVWMDGWTDESGCMWVVIHIYSINEG